MTETKQVGRPTLCTPEVTARIVQALEVGNTLSVAAEINGISEKAAYNWMARGRAGEEEFVPFLQSIQAARSRAEAGYAALLHQHARGRIAVPEVRDAEGKITRPGLPAMSPTWQACAWWLERRNPKRWGPKIRIIVEEELNAALDKLKRALTPEVYVQVLAALSDESGEAEVGTAQAAQLVAGSDEGTETPEPH